MVQCTPINSALYFYRAWALSLQTCDFQTWARVSIMVLVCINGHSAVCNNYKVNRNTYMDICFQFIFVSCWKIPRLKKKRVNGKKLQLKSHLDLVCAHIQKILKQVAQWCMEGSIHIGWSCSTCVFLGISKDPPPYFPPPLPSFVLSQP